MLISIPKYIISRYYAKGIVKNYLRELRFIIAATITLSLETSIYLLNII